MSRKTSAMANRDRTRQRLKDAAQQLFAQRGIDAVSIQEIVSAAGQRNNASLHYYFGTKDELVMELVVDGAKLVDQRRQAMLDEMERVGGPTTVRDVVYALIWPVISLGESEEQQGTYVRFIATLQLSHRGLLRKALEDKWNTGYRRCLDHIRRLLPGLPSPLLEQRLSIVGIYGNAVLAAREAALEAGAESHRFWGHTHTMENIIDTIQASLECAPSPATLDKLGRGS
jgi:AcrR family transcriptional regulator